MSIQENYEKLAIWNTGIRAFNKIDRQHTNLIHKTVEKNQNMKELERKPNENTKQIKQLRRKDSTITNRNYIISITDELYEKLYMPLKLRSFQRR